MRTRKRSEQYDLAPADALTRASRQYHAEARHVVDNVRLRVQLEAANLQHFDADGRVALWDIRHDRFDPLLPLGHRGFHVLSASSVGGRSERTEATLMELRERGARKSKFAPHCSYLDDGLEQLLAQSASTLVFQDAKVLDRRHARPVLRHDSPAGCAHRSVTDCSSIAVSSRGGSNR